MDQRRQLVRVARDPGADPAEVALRVQAFHERDLDVPTALLRIDALADLVRTRGEALGGDGPRAVADRLRVVLGEQLGYGGDPTLRRTHRHAFLGDTLDARHGLPVTLSALWAGVARRLGATAHVVNLPGHVVAAVGTRGHERSVTVDAFGGGAVLDEGAVARLVDRATGGTVAFHRSMLRPATPAALARRLLTNLTVDLRREGPPDAAVWTVVARLALPDPDPADHRLLGDLLASSGRFLRAARAYERWEQATPDEADAARARELVRMVRSRLN